MRKKKNYSRRREVFFVVLTVLISIVVVCATMYNQQKCIDCDVFPKINIDLNNVTLKEINDNEKWVKYGGNTVTLSSRNGEEVFKDVEMKGRGNYSWLADKKSYNIKFPNKVNLLEIGKHKKWALVANSLDDSFLRNDLGHYIANVIFKNNNINGDFVELDVNGKNIGLYYLSELVSINKESVDIRSPLAILVEMDKPYCQEEEEYYTSTWIKDCFIVKDYRNHEEYNIVMRDFMRDYNYFENALIHNKTDEIFNYIDEDSWAKYYLLSEFTGDVDAYVTSWYMYKDGVDDKIHAGPGWDFDAAFGNKNWGGDWPEDFYSPDTQMARLKFSFGERDDYVGGQGMGCRYNLEEKKGSLEYVSPVMCYLLDVPDFNNKVEKIYKETLMGKRNLIVDYIKNKASYIKEAAIKDSEKWNKGDFEEAVDYLVWWVDKRFDLFDALYGEKRTEFLEEPSEV